MEKMGDLCKFRRKIGASLSRNLADQEGDTFFGLPGSLLLFSILMNYL